MNSCTTEKFKVYIRWQEAVCGVLLPNGVNFADLVKYVWKKFKINDLSVIRVSYYTDSTNVTIRNDEDVVIFKNMCLGSPSDVQTLIVELANKTTDVELDHQDQTELPDLNFMPIPPLPPTYQNIPPSDKKSGLLLNHMFEDKEECQYEIGLKCLTEGYEFRVIKSSKTRFVVECVQPLCGWHINCYRFGKTNLFRITAINDKHNCSKIQFHPNHRNAYAKTLARIIAPKLSDLTRVYRPKDFIRDLKLGMNIDVSYKRAWKGKQLALEASQGCPKESFAQLPIFCYNLKLSNRGTVTHIQTDNQRRFKDLFIGFGAAVSVLTHYMVPFV